MLSPEVGTPDARRRKIFLLSDQIGFTRTERIEFSQYLLRRDIISWTQLDNDQVNRLLDALEGVILAAELARLRA